MPRIAVSASKRLQYGGLLAAVAALAFGAAGSAQAPPGELELISFWTGTGTPAVWVMHPDGSSRRLVTRFPQPAKRGSLSPDGRRLVFDGTRTATGARDDFDIEVVGLDGTGRRWLTSGAARDTDASWSPDGRTIVFQRLVRMATSIWVVRADGTHTRTLGRGSDPSFSPSGRRIAFSRDGDVYSMRADGSAAQRVRHGPDDEAPAGWSPDGRRILFTVLSTTAHRATVWSMRSNGTDVRRVTRGPYDVAAAWSPDGARVLLTRIVPFANSERGTVVVIRTDGTGAHVLTGGAGDEYATSWQSLR